MTRLRARGLFVTGTDTGVGKTRVACELLRRLRARGRAVGVLKPIETGVGPAGPLDALALRAAAGLDEQPIQDVCPQAFALPAAPNVAAAAEGRCVDLRVIDAAFERAMTRYDAVLVEGAGGLLVPIDARTTMADLAARFALPLLVVCRAALGTLNHTRLTLEAARARGLPVAGLVISHADGPLSAADAANLEDLRRAPGVTLLGELPPLDDDAPAPEDALDVEPLLAVLDAARPRAQSQR